MKWSGWAVLTVAAVAAVVTASYSWGQPHSADSDLGVRIEAIAPGGLAVTQACQRPGTPPPTVLLVLGQSNAGNHGAEDEAGAEGDAPRVTLFTGGHCEQAGDPLPGGTGRHHSIWARLPAHLKRLGFGNDVVFVLLAVDATSMSDWAREGSPLRARLDGVLREMQAGGLQPDKVLWQQGEADAQLGTTAGAYMDGFEAVLAALRAGGVNAPVLMARSTVCGGADGRAVRQAIQRLSTLHSDVLVGPDHDSLRGEDRLGGCHFSRSGLDAAAAAWAHVIVHTAR